jgi:uncharacterized protein YjbJ (UPF0337 family)
LNLNITFQSEEAIFKETDVNKDQFKGTVKEVKGKIKEVTGKIVGNKTLEEKGAVEKATGIVQRGFGDVKEDIDKGI